MTRTADTITPRPLQWLWPARLPCGMLSLLVGDPGLAKTTLSVDLIARVTTGAQWPDGAPNSSPISPSNRDVLWLTCEDPIAEVLIPRVHAAGADASRIRLLERMPDGARPHIKKHAAALRDCLLADHPALLVIDPLNAYLGGTKVYEDQEIRTVLEPLVSAAADSGTAILALMHLTKDASRRLLYRIQGSIAFVGVARAVFCCEETDVPGQRRFRALKANLAPPDLPTLLYHVEADLAGVTHVVWEGPELSAPPPSPPPMYEPFQEEAEAWLLSALSQGPVEYAALKSQAAKEGYTDWVLRVARRRLGIKATRTGGFPSRSVWSI